MPSAVTFCFNSIVVRLKVLPPIQRKVPIVGFNSIVVRLKGIYAIQCTSEKQRFQFHSGSIKSSGERVYALDTDTFQFHSGSIKRVRRFLHEGDV